MAAARLRTFDGWALNPFDWRHDMHSSPLAGSVAWRRIASPLIAATLLTAAVFLLPAPGVGHQAQASAGHVAPVAVR